MRGEQTQDCILPRGLIALASPYPWGTIDMTPHLPRGLQCFDTSDAAMTLGPKPTQCPVLWGTRGPAKQESCPQDSGSQCVIFSEPKSCPPGVCCPYHQQLCPLQQWNHPGAENWLAHSQLTVVSNPAPFNDGIRSPEPNNQLMQGLLPPLSGNFVSLAAEPHGSLKISLHGAYYCHHQQPYLPQQWGCYAPAWHPEVQGLVCLVLATTTIDTLPFPAA